MSNRGRIDVTMEPAVVDQIMGLIDQIEVLLPFLMLVKPSEKPRLVKPRAGMQEVVETIADLQRESGMVLVQEDPMLADLSVHTGLTTIGDRLSGLTLRIEDTKLVAGSECWSEGLVRYGMLRQLERGNPALKSRLDRVQRLIARRSSRPAPAPIEDAPELPGPIETEPTK
jgi:hypothetical protein